jgi:hypothetical protein
MKILEYIYNLFFKNLTKYEKDNNNERKNPSKDHC